MDARVKPAHDEYSLRTASRRMQQESRPMPATNQPDGQINQNPVQPSGEKYSARAVGQISDLTPRVSPD
jgi:hypothetical protein